MPRTVAPSQTSPSRAPPSTSVKKCMPRYIREEATSRGSPNARARKMPRISAERARSKASTASAPHSATVAAVCPEGKLAVGQQGDGEEDRHLAGHRHRHQHGLAPAAPQQSGRRHRHHGQGGDGQGAADLGGDGGGVVELAVALTGQPPADARVGPADGVVLDHVLSTQPSPVSTRTSTAAQASRNRAGGTPSRSRRQRAARAVSRSSGPGSSGPRRLLAAIRLLPTHAADIERMLSLEGEQTILSPSGLAMAMLALPLRREVAGPGRGGREWSDGRE